MAFPPGSGCSTSISTSIATLIGPGVTSVTNLPAGLNFPGIIGADFIDGTCTAAPGLYSGSINGQSTTWQVFGPGANYSWTPDSSIENMLHEGVASTLVLTPTGGTGTVTFKLYNANYPFCPPLGDPLPAGLTLQTNGHVTGTPTVGGTHTNTEISLLDTVFRGPIGGLKIFVVAAPPPPLAASCAAPLDGIVGTEYIHLFVATGGTPPYSFTSFGGEPPGLTLASNGELTGIPTTPGTFSLDMRVNDFAGDGPLPLTCSITINTPATTNYVRHGVLQGFVDNSLAPAGAKPNQFENWDNFAGSGFFEDLYVVGAPQVNTDPGRTAQIDPSKSPYLGNEFLVPFAIPIGTPVTITLTFDGPTIPSGLQLVGWIMPDGNPGDSITEIGPFIGPGSTPVSTVWTSTVDALFISVLGTVVPGVVNYPYTITISIPGGGGGSQVASPYTISSGGSGQHGFGI